MESLEPLWDALEDSPRLVGVEQELRDALADAYPIIAPYLTPSGRLAKRYPCPFPGDPGCPRRIVKESNDRFRAVCGAETSECGPLNLSRKEVEVLTFNAESFARALQQTMGIPARASIIRHGGDLIELGVLRLDPLTRLPVVLLMPATQSSANVLLHEVFVIYRQGAVLLTPTDKLIDGAMESRLIGSGFTWLVLGSILFADGAQFATKQPLVKLVTPTPAAPPSATAEPDHRFPTPPDADWKDIHIRFTDGHTVTIKLGDVGKVVTYSEMNMKRAHNGQPTAIWKLLRSFAESDGRFDWRNSDASRKIKQRVSRLRKTLKAFFGLNTDPFFRYQKGVGYRARFQIRPER